MKKNINLLLLLALYAIVVVGCTTNDKFSGSPEGNLDIVTIEATVSTTTEFALQDQKIPIEIDLHRTFSDTVTVEASTLSKSGGRLKASIDVLPGHSTAIGEVPAVGGALYDNTTFDLYLSAIVLKKVETGKHYLITSNRIAIATGSTSIPDVDDSKLQMKVSWPTIYDTQNNLKLIIERPHAASASTYDSGPTASSPATPGNRIATVASTSGLAVGMNVIVGSGTGNFSNNSVVVSINSATTFTVNQNILTPLSNATVLGVANDYVSSNANNDTTVTPKNVITVPSTTGLYPGMVVWVTSGTGAFKASTATTVASILSPTSFKISSSNTIMLVNATISAVFPYAIPGYDAAGKLHDILNDGSGNTASSSATPPGDYYLKISAINLINSGADLPYRITLRLPTGEVKLFLNGVYSNATIGGPIKPILKVTKTGIGSAASYSFTEL
jgi:hypothetical protein